MTKLSIIIPAYNAEPYLERCLESVRVGSENLHDVQIIVIDDGSTDGTKKVLDKYEERVGYTIKRHSTNWGVGMTRNHALALARGRWITFLDADDELAPDAAGRMLRLIDDGITFPLIMFNHMRAYGNEAPVPKFKNDRGVYGLRHLPQKWTTVWGKMVLKDFIDANRIRFNEHISYGEDEIFLLECLRVCRMIQCVNDFAVIKHSDNTQSLTKTLTKKKLTSFIRAELDLIEEDNDAEFSDALRQIIADHWDRKTFIQTFGGYT